MRALLAVLAVKHQLWFPKADGETMITILEAATELGKARSAPRNLAPFLIDDADCRNVGWQFLKAASSFGRHFAMVTASQEVCYSSLAVAAIHVSSFLSELADFCPGDRVALLADNSPEYVAGFYGTLLAGGVVVPLPTRIEPGRLAELREACDASIVLTDTQTAERRSDMSAETAEHRVDLARELSVPPGRFAAELPQEDELALLLYTSGSTGSPKGAMLSHGNVLANAKSILEYLPIQPEDRTLVLLPFCHAFGNSVLQTHILSGATIVVDGSSAFPNTIVDALQHHQVNSFAGVPELYTSLLTCSDLGQRALPDLRYMTVAGGALRSEETLEVAQRIAPAKFFKMYGQTEATARLAFLPPEELSEHPDSIGKAIPGVELQVQDEEGCEVAPRETGELCARGGNVMRGYWNDQTATSKVLKGGWLRTGDMACSDQEGLLYLKGRRNNEIKIRGIRLDLDAITATLVTSFPGYRVVLVPFQMNGTARLGMFLEGGDQASELSAVQAGLICRETLPRHEVPNHIERIDRFPLTATLKIDLQALSLRATRQCTSSHVRESVLCGAASSDSNAEQA